MRSKIFYAELTKETQGQGLTLVTQFTGVLNVMDLCNCCVKKILQDKPHADQKREPVFDIINAV